MNAGYTEVEAFDQEIAITVKVSYDNGDVVRLKETDDGDLILSVYNHDTAKEGHRYYRADNPFIIKKSFIKIDEALLTEI